MDFEELFNEAENVESEIVDTEEIEETEEVETSESESEQSDEIEEEQTEETKTQSVDERRANAARRRAQERSADRQNYNSEIAKLGLRNPYRDNAQVTTLEEMAQYNADKSLHDMERDIRTNGITDEIRQKIVDSDPEVQAAKGLIAQARREAAKATIESQFAELKEFYPNIGSLEELMTGEKGEEFQENAKITKDLLKAYKLTFMDEILTNDAIKMQKAAGSGKEHLRKTSARGAGAVQVTQDIIDTYRLLDPNITLKEIQDAESKYRKKET